jgi:transketolase
MKAISATLSRIANQLRIHSIEATTRAGSGHPTSCCSAADLVAALFFGKMRFDTSKPRDIANDRFVLSKGHAAPLLYAAWAETGHVDVEEIHRLRDLSSPFEGHPTPRLDFVDVATGSRGQGLSAGLGMAIGAKLDGSDANIFVLMGDGEVAEGSVWEAASLAGTRKASNLVAIVDVNRLGQSQATAFGADAEIYRARFEAFGWKAVSIDGHDLDAILNAYDRVGDTGDRPYAIIASTLKGKGIAGIEGKDGWHGKQLPREKADEAIAALKPIASSARGLVEIPKPRPIVTTGKSKAQPAAITDYDRSKPVSTRKAFGNALARVGAANDRIVVLDGDTENSTYTEDFGQKVPERFIECYIAEQNMVGVAAGLSAVGKVPFAATFACFLTRAYDQLRMCAISESNLKLVGTHAGISIGEDGPSQMGLEDIAMMRALAGSVVLSPSDAISTERLIELMASRSGLHYLRAARPNSPLIYSNDETFELGGAKLLRQSDTDQVTLVATGITVPEALSACDVLAESGIGATVIDAYSIKPLGADVIRAAMLRTGGRIVTVEDHSLFGGLGDAVAGELSIDGAKVLKLGLKDVPHSGKKDELMARYGIDSAAIVKAAHGILELRPAQSAA